MGPDQTLAHMTAIMILPEQGSRPEGLISWVREKIRPKQQGETPWFNAFTQGDLENTAASAAIKNCPPMSGIVVLLPETLPKGMLEWLAQAVGEMPDFFSLIVAHPKGEGSNSPIQVWSNLVGNGVPEGIL